MKRTLIVLPVLLACGAPVSTKPSQAQIEDAQERVQQSMASAEQARIALELLGILPTYTCGESRALFVGKRVSNVQLGLGCVTVRTDAR